MQKQAPTHRGDYEGNKKKNNCRLGSLQKKASTQNAS